MRENSNKKKTDKTAIVTKRTAIHKISESGKDQVEREYDFLCVQLFIIDLREMNILEILSSI